MAQMAIKRMSAVASSSLVRFLVAGVVSIALYWWKLNGYIAQALGVAPYALVGYLGSRLFVFRRAAP